MKNSNSDIIGDSDADWSGDLNDRKSTTGFFYKFEGNGGAISWEVKKQEPLSVVRVGRVSSDGGCRTGSNISTSSTGRFWPTNEETDRYWRRESILYQNVSQQNYTSLEKG